LRNIIFLLFIFLFSGCTRNVDIEEEIYAKKDLQEDIKILEGIVTDMHAGAYTYNTPQSLHLLFDSVRNSIQTDVDLRSFYKKVNFILDRLKCLHTDVSIPDIYYDSIYNREEFFPIPLYSINNKLYVNSDNHIVPLGAEVLFINSLPANKIINDLKILYHTDGNNEKIRAKAINENFSYYFYLTYGGFKSFSVQFIKDSSKKSEVVKFVPESLKTIDGDGYQPYFFLPNDVNYDLEMLDNSSTAILTIKTFNFETGNAYNAYLHFLENSFRLINGTGIKNLVIDCRDNGGGFYNSTYNTISYLVNEKMKEHDSVFQRFNTVTYKEYIAPSDTASIGELDTAFLSYNKIAKDLYKYKAEEITEWKPQSEVYNGKVFVLINAGVASAASNFAAILKDKINAVVVGEESGGSNTTHQSNTIHFILPTSKLKITIPLNKYYQPINKKLEGRGVIPDKEVLFTVRDLINDEDKQLYYILDSLIRK
jgi:Peptidase family S41